MSNEDLIALAKKEMGYLGLINAEKVFDGYVVRQPKAYPVYDENYQQCYECLIILQNM